MRRQLYDPQEAPGTCHLLRAVQETERLEREQEREVQKLIELERTRRQAARQAEADRVEAERQEAQRLEVEARRQQAEARRQQAEAASKAEADRVEAQRQQAEAASKAEAQRLEAQRQQAEAASKAEAQRLEAEAASKAEAEVLGIGEPQQQAVQDGADQVRELGYFAGWLGGAYQFPDGAQPVAAAGDAEGTAGGAQEGELLGAAADGLAAADEPGGNAVAPVAPAAVEPKPPAVVRVSVKWGDRSYEGDMTQVLDPQNKLRAICRKYSKEYSKDTSLSDKRVWLVNYDDGSKHYYCMCNDDHTDGPTTSYFCIQGDDYKEVYEFTVLP